MDRGSFSVEVVLLIYTIKMTFEGTVFLLRGNHECRQMTSFFNFRTECLYKYDQETYELFMETFDALPISCLVNGKFLALHGGISPDLKTVRPRPAYLARSSRTSTTSTATRSLPRSACSGKPSAVHLARICSDILWSDPVEDDKGYCEKTFKTNEVRGCSYFFG